MRALSEVPYVVSTFWMQRGPGRRLGGAKVSMRRVSVHVWVDAPLTTRVTLNMMDFDGREVRRSAKSFEVPHVSSTHRLRATGSRDASLRVESTRAWRFCGCVRWRATLGPCITHELTHLDERAVGGAPPRVARVVSQVLPLRAHLLRAKESHNAFGRVGSTHHVERFCVCGRGRATPGPHSARDGAFGWASGVARPRVARAICGAVASIF